MEKKETKVLVVCTPDAEERRAMLAALDDAQMSEREFKPIVLELKGRRNLQGSPFVPLMFGMMGISAGYQGGWPQGRGPYWPEPQKPTKRCLQCGKDHKHNNSYCSAQCCKEHTNGQKLLRSKTK